MSFLPCADPDATHDCREGVEMIILPRTSDIGNFEVKRALPFREKRLVGPFIFWDQMGPGEFLSGQGIDVRPHPHIGLSTVTYLLDGSLDHKDSLGSDLRIHPGDVNLMNAGGGVVHSERTGKDIRSQASRLFGIQSWLAQPKEFENGLPSFSHTSAQELPVFQEHGVEGRVILGSFSGLTSPVEMQWDTLYVDLKLRADTCIQIPKETEERAIFVLSGKIEIAHTSYDPTLMMVLTPGEDITLHALTDVRLMILGGATMDGPRHIFWNFVSSSKDRVQQAMNDWRQQKFPAIPGDSEEFAPLPDTKF